jgi:hypothetical protein
MIITLFTDPAIAIAPRLMLYQSSIYAKFELSLIQVSPACLTRTPLRYISLELPRGATIERDEDEFSLRGGTQNGAHSPTDAGYARA